mmetsp:Transcript_28870/g.66538  ORF Transcript_28870/g.66538 Transcript_28870/m.66538 type:complete len:233 (+) Transcript_28870:59-757(+)
MPLKGNLSRVTSLGAFCCHSPDPPGLAVSRPQPSTSTQRLPSPLPVAKLQKTTLLFGHSRQLAQQIVHLPWEASWDHHKFHHSRSSPVSTPPNFGGHKASQCPGALVGNNTSRRVNAPRPAARRLPGALLVAVCIGLHQSPCRRTSQRSPLQQLYVVPSDTRHTCMFLRLRQHPADLPRMYQQPPMRKLGAERLQGPRRRNTWRESPNHLVDFLLQHRCACNAQTSLRSGIA